MSLDLNTQMVQGQTYTFHFHWPLSLNVPAPQDVVNSLSGDSNFGSPVAATEQGGTKVDFIYQGQGSNVGDAGTEMQNVINDNLPSLSHGVFVGFYYAFTSADLGEVSTAPGNLPDTISFTTIAVVLIVGLLVASVFLHETIKAKEVL